MAAIAQNSSGFLYCVSSPQSMIDQVRQVSDIPCAVGFDISTPEQAKTVSSYADGVIVGSAIVRIVAEHGQDSVKPVYEYAKSIKQGI
jgi:tryptophan synthase alpha chain